MGSGATTPVAMDITSALHRLVQAFQQHGPDAQLLPFLRKAFVALKLKAADRGYRYEFTENYILLLGQDRNYRPEILQAAMSQDPDLWVNGTLYHISPATLEKGHRLKQCFLQICNLLAMPESQEDVGVLVCSRLARALSVFESQWVQFEELYVKELIRIESLARVPLEKAVEMELVLLNLEHAKPKSSMSAQLAENAVHHMHLPVPRRRVTTSDASSRATPSSHGTQMSLPRHPRNLPAASAVSGQSSPPSNVSQESLPFPEGFPSGYDRQECPRSRQQTLSGEIPSMAMASQMMGHVPEPTPRKCELQHLAESAVARGSTRRNFLEELVARVCVLNACANARGKGRSDMTADVLEAAAKVFLAEATPSHPADIARATLARAVLESFLAVRRYLSEVSKRVLWIDPQLCNNEDLEALLVAWEDAWEMGSAFLLKAELSDAVCGVAVVAAHAAGLEPTFANMVEDQDAELFLILPRLVLLSGLQDQKNLALARSILPDLQVGVAEVSGLEPGENSSQRSWHWSLEESLTRLQHEVEDPKFWDFLTMQVIRGPGSSTVQSTNLEAFLRELEALSMQLQRKEPQKWNRCSSVLLRCISAVTTASS